MFSTPFSTQSTIYRLGSNDRRTALFENLWPLPQGMSYNAYLILDKSNVLIDTMNSCYGRDLVSVVDQLIQNNLAEHPEHSATLDYLIIQHMEPDHSTEISNLIRQYPGVKIIGNKKTFEILSQYYPTGDTSKIEVQDGETLSLGKHSLKFIFTPWLHWPETMMTLEESTQTLFSADAFGMYGALNGGLFDDETNIDILESEMRRYYSNIIGKYSAMVQKALVKLGASSIKSIAPLHGIVWRSNPQHAIALYDRWCHYQSDEAVVIAYASMYGFTEAMAEHIAQSIAKGGIKDIHVFDVSKTHPSFIESEVWRSKYIILGSCAYNGGMLPTMETLCNILGAANMKGKYLGIFGSCSWNGGGVKNLQAFAEKSGWEQLSAPIEIKGQSNPEKLALCQELIQATLTLHSETQPCPN